MIKNFNLKYIATFVLIVIITLDLRANNIGKYSVCVEFKKEYLTNLNQGFGNKYLSNNSKSLSPENRVRYLFNEDKFNKKDTLSYPTGLDCDYTLIVITSATFSCVTTLLSIAILKGDAEQNLGTAIPIGMIANILLSGNMLYSCKSHSFKKSVLVSAGAWFALNVTPSIIVGDKDVWLVTFPISAIVAPITASIFGKK